MKLQVLGTGSGDGWPNPFCECASCEWMRATGSARVATSVLIDDQLLIDCGPAIPVNASRFGARLRGVSHVLLSHSHPDHNSAAALLWREFAKAQGHLVVAGPAAALVGWNDWVAPDAEIEFRPVTAGNQFDLGPYSVTAIPANHGGDGSGEALLYAIRGPDANLFYGTDTGALSAMALCAMESARFDVVLLEETFGDLTAHHGEHLDLESFPRELERLRDVGAITDQTRVIAVHLSHHNPVEPELSTRLAAWGAEVLQDGAVIEIPSARLTKRTLVTGGARSGKSVFAESLLADVEAVEYVATGPDGADDDEWSARIGSHQQRRPQTWTTLETRDLVKVLNQDGPPVLIDCLSLWLTHQCDISGVWDESAGSSARLTTATEELLTAWEGTTRRAIIVTNEVGSGVVPASVSGRRFRDELGRLNARIAAVSEETWLVTAGRAQLLP